MDIQFIDIRYEILNDNTPIFFGIVGDQSKFQEALVSFGYMGIADEIIFDSKNNKFKYYPNYKDAKALFKKRYRNSAISQDVINEYVNDGVDMFFTIYEVVKAAKKTYKNSILCFSFCGSRIDFVKFMNDKPFAGAVYNILGVKRNKNKKS